jgi:hypothetical protein
MYRVIPNSHYWPSIETLINYLELTPDTINREYLIIGLKNSLEHGYDLRKRRPQKRRKVVKRATNKPCLYYQHAGAPCKLGLMNSCALVPCKLLARRT